MGNSLAKRAKLDLRSHQTQVTMHALRMFSARQNNGPVSAELTPQTRAEGCLALVCTDVFRLCPMNVCRRSFLLLMVLYSKVYHVAAQITRERGITRDILVQNMHPCAKQNSCTDVLVNLGLHQ